MIQVCDAIMGTGKSSAAITYMNEHQNEKFIYITPYLEEADRIKKGCKAMHFVEPSDKLKQYGFKNIQTPTFEFFDIFNRERGTVKSADMFKFFDQYNNTLVLRPDITPSIARCVAKYYEKEEMQIRLCYTGSTFTRLSGYQGKLSEITQLGAEMMNDASSDADGEIIAMTIECLQKSGLKEFKVDIGHADIFRGLIEETDLSEEEIETLKTYLNNKNIFAVEDMLENRDMPQECKNLLVKMPDLFGGIETITYVKEQTTNKRALKALERLEKIYEILSVSGLEDHITFDLGLLSHYEYYTGVIFKAYTYGTGDAIVTGGRYDNLVEQFGKKTPAVGFALLLDQLMEALRSQEIPIEAQEKDYLILYRSANRKKALEMAKSYRADNQPARLLRKDAQTPLSEYIAYGKRNEVSKLLYIDDTGEISEFDLSEM